MLSGDWWKPNHHRRNDENHPTMRNFRPAQNHGQPSGRISCAALSRGRHPACFPGRQPLAAENWPRDMSRTDGGLQSAFYGEGSDVLAPEVQMR
ncbi:MAG: hypothetical protein ACLSTO_10805 [Bilophila wadsworthia]